MMTSSEIRQQFLDFFASKEHKIVPSSPIVNKDDPSLMFTNAGMNQFKDYFLGNRDPEVPRIADTQKCLRVSGKHNDLEEVGRDSYHHTMFEMLGNWSFGNYFKEEAIEWAWELLTKVFGIDPGRLYVSVFEGDEQEGLAPDAESANFWKKWIAEDRILYFDKKDNFWEMGDTGPCGPCSEIHIDLRDDADREKVSGANLVNQDDPLVVEVWNLVFIQFNRKADKSLEELPAKHVDTGMGFERLCMALQNAKSNYDTDVFSPFIEAVEKTSGKKYTYSYAPEAKSDIAMRVIVDHLRAVAFTIADGQLPDNNGAGYVIRRILRRAVRYYYSFLDIKEPFIYSLVPLLAQRFGHVFPEIEVQKEQIANIIKGEEKLFLNTLENGLRRFAALEVKNDQIDGQSAFELLDTFGFPIDLTQLLAEEKGWTVDEAGFKAALQVQKDRSRADARKEVGDWTTLQEGNSEFVGYDTLIVEQAKVLKYRTVTVKDKSQYQIVLDTTPFYAESGGQSGDKGLLTFGEEKIPVIDTLKENDLTIHHVKKFPGDLTVSVKAEVNSSKRQATSSNHTATHLMHAALHRILGTHALQKGQSVDDRRLRFDFSHFQAISKEELEQIEHMVNTKIRKNIALDEQREMPLEEAKVAGAMMLFGEKYGEKVRVITFDKDFSSELCGGTHVAATGEIGLFKIVSESAIAAGIRRIEAVTSDAAEAYLVKELDELQSIRDLFKNPQHLQNKITALQEENKSLKKEIEKLQSAQANVLKDQLKGKIEEISGVKYLSARLPLNDAKAIKTLAHQLEQEVNDVLIIFGAEVKGKPQLTIIVSESLIAAKDLHAGNMVKTLAKEIRGGGGGQAFFATAGGSDLSGLDAALEKAKELI